MSTLDSQDFSFLARRHLHLSFVLKYCKKKLDHLVAATESKGEARFPGHLTISQNKIEFSAKEPFSSKTKSLLFQATNFLNLCIMLMRVANMIRSNCLFRFVLLVIDICFFDVRFMCTERLAALPPESYYLLDVRSEEEFCVSHLPCAIQTLPPDLPHNTLVIVYCSIGWRSALCVRQLKRRGFDNLLNLRGSIFLWAMEGRPLEHANVVHPFNRFWGRLLPKHLRAPFVDCRALF